MHDATTNSDQRPQGVGRRRFLRLAGLGVVSTSLLAACAPAAPAAPTAAPAAATTAPTAAPAAKPPAASAAKPTTAPAAAAKPAEAPKAAAATTAPAAAKPTAAPAAAASGNWQAKWDQVLADARKEGKVVVYGPPGDAIRRNFTEGFTRAYPGIQLEWNGAQSSQSAVKLEAERRAGVFTADVFIGGSTTANTQLRPMGASDPIPEALILPEVSDPKQWIGDKLDFTDNPKQFNLAFVNVPSTTLAYNKDLVQPSEMQDPQDLLNPKWKGKVLITDPIPSGGGNSAHRLFWYLMGPEEGTKFIRALREQAPAQGGVDRDARRILENTARGRFAVCVGVSDGTLSQLEQQGITNLGKVRGFKTHGGNVTSSFGTVTRINRPPNPNAQLVFINWLLTKDGQTAYSTAMNQPSLRKDAPVDHLSPDARLDPTKEYWASYREDQVEMDPQLKALLQELYGRTQS